MNSSIVPTFPKAFNTFRSGTPIADDHYALFPDRRIHQYLPRGMLQTDLLEVLNTIP
jgi:hypothetical protein